MRQLAIIGVLLLVVVSPQAQPTTGPLADATVQDLLTQFHVPGVSIAVIKNFQIDWAKGYGVADAASSVPVTADTMFQAASISKTIAAMTSMKAVQDGRFTLDQDVNSILKSWKLPGGEFTRDRPVTPRMLMSHTSGTGDGFGFPGYSPDGAVPSVVQILDGLPPSNREKVRLERPPMTGFKYSGGAVMIQQLALTDAAGKPFAELARDWVLKPIGMANSTFEQPLPASRHAQAARAHDRAGKRMDAPWHVYPELAAAGLWTTSADLAKFLIEVQLTLLGKSNRVLKSSSMLEMVTPVGVGPFAVGFTVEKQGEGWYFMHGGSNWGFQCDMIAHRAKGYGMAIMTNGDNGGALIRELRTRLERDYAWDVFDKPIPRTYGPRGNH
jgi:CubicO group peptidase (beta-lactamase class C family)